LSTQGRTENGQSSRHPAFKGNPRKSATPLPQTCRRCQRGHPSLVGFVRRQTNLLFVRHLLLAIQAGTQTRIRANRSCSRNSAASCFLPRASASSLISCNARRWKALTTVLTLVKT